MSEEEARTIAPHSRYFASGVEAVSDGGCNSYFIDIGLQIPAEA